MITNMRTLEALAASLDDFSVPRHPDVDKAIAAHEAVQRSMVKPAVVPGRLIDIEPARFDGLVTELAVRQDVNNISSAGMQLQGRLLEEGDEAIKAHVPVIIETLRKPFDLAAKEIAKATKAGVRPGMNAESIIALDNPEAIKAWRSLGEHTRTLDEIAAIRIRLSTELNISPNITLAQEAIGEEVDYTACFTHPDTGIVSGWSHRPGSQHHRWIALSLATNGRLRLNMPDETSVMIYGSEASPGWIVCSGSAIVTDDDGRQLMLYTDGWIPSWVNDTQIAHLIDGGLVVPARPGAERPADARPLQ